MIEDDSHPEMQKAAQQLAFRLTAIAQGKPLTGQLYQQMIDMVKDHRQSCRLKGIDFPVMVPIMVPRLSIIDFVRADLEKASIRVQMVNFVRKYPDATVNEVVAAFVAAYPDLHPDDLKPEYAKIQQ